MVVNFLDQMGAIRRSHMLDEFCALEDSNYIPEKIKKHDPLINRVANEINIFKEIESEKAMTPLSRGIPFDIDDDIVVMPDFLNR
jgi:hypothetical protein